LSYFCGQIRVLRHGPCAATAGYASQRVSLYLARGGVLVPLAFPAKSERLARLRKTGKLIWIYNHKHASPQAESCIKTARMWIF
jgi:hypothetical protein